MHLRLSPVYHPPLAEDLAIAILLRSTHSGNVLRLLLLLFGSAISLLPIPILRLLCRVLGLVFFCFFPRRRRILLSNLCHALPQKSPGELRRLALENSSRLVEMGLFSLAAPFFSRRRILKNFDLGGDWGEVVRRLRRGGLPQLLLIPHQTLGEALPFLPLLLGVGDSAASVGVLYRPFGNGYLDEFVKKTRGRHGLRLLSRRNGLVEAANLLGRGGCVALLFDQSAPSAGVQTLLCGRVTHSTPLPDILRRRGDVPAFLVWTRRHSFWRATLLAESLPAAPGETVFAANRWLEERLSGDGEFQKDWLWAHNRWKRGQERLLTLESRKDRLRENVAYLGLERLPKKFFIRVRVPDDSSGVAAATELLTILRSCRPDAFLEVVCAPEFAQRLAPHADTLLFRKSPATRRPDFYLVLSPSSGAEWEAFRSGAAVRVGFGQRKRTFPLTLRLRAADSLPLLQRWCLGLRRLGLPDEFRATFTKTAAQSPPCDVSMGES
jgi:lauroyl/myristoyl acyltransferase